MNKTVKIGPQIFAIIFKEGLQDASFKSLDGWVRFSESNIYLDKRLDTFAQKQVLWHEILHGLAAQMGADLPENVIDAFAYGILGVLQDNAWLTK